MSRRTATFLQDYFYTKRYSSTSFIIPKDFTSAPKFDELFQITFDIISTFKDKYLLDAYIYGDPISSIAFELYSIVAA